MPQPVANQTRSWWHRALDLFTLHPPKAFRTHHDPVTAASLVPEPASPAQSKAPRSPTSPQSPTSAASQKKSKSLWRISQGGHGSSRGHSSAAGERLITHIASDDQFEQLVRPRALIECGPDNLARLMMVCVNGFCAQINGGQWVLVDFRECTSGSHSHYCGSILDRCAHTHVDVLHQTPTGARRARPSRLILPHRQSSWSV